ncbi:hypothetical protein HDG37_001019 [Paraburkholderia sp. MM5384-R2]|nr:hypothetical protein [Paraburkholderia sp. MM5384-R2]
MSVARDTFVPGSLEVNCSRQCGDESSLKRFHSFFNV